MGRAARPPGVMPVPTVMDWRSTDPPGESTAADDDAGAAHDDSGSVTVRLSHSSTVASHPGGTTVVDSGSSTIAGPAICEPGVSW